MYNDNLVPRAIFLKNFFFRLALIVKRCAGDEVVYNDTITSFEELLVKGKTFTIHHQNIQSLAIQMYKVVNNLPGGNLSEFFVRTHHNDNLRSTSELRPPLVEMLFIVFFYCLCEYETRGSH